jgi:hypothetical protein
MHDGLRKHKLMTKAIEKRFAQVGRQEEEEDPIVIAKFFNPYGIATWLATEYDPKNREFYGFVNMLGADCAEWGPFSLDELDQTLILFGGCKLPLERDCYWTEKPMSEARKEIGC